jgi:tetratricopeptide (TPR) repeat protein
VTQADSPFRPINVALAPEPLTGALYPLPVESSASEPPSPGVQTTPKHELPSAYLASGFVPGPAWNLTAFGGKTIADLVFVNRYVGGAALWSVDDMTNIDAALSKALSDPGLQTVIAQYYPGVQISSTMLPSATHEAPVPATVYKDSVEDLARELYAAGAIGSADPESTVINIVLPHDVVLSSARQSGLGGDSEAAVTSKRGLAGYHSSVHQADGTTIYYAVAVYSEGDNGIVAFAKAWQNIAAVLYHQLNESRTDPDVGDVSSTNDASKLGWYSQEGGEIGDLPIMRATGDLSLVFMEVPLADGSGFAPIQLMWSNADGGPAAATGPSVSTAVQDAKTLLRRVDQLGTEEHQPSDQDLDHLAEQVLTTGRYLLESYAPTRSRSNLDTAIALYEALLQFLPPNSQHTAAILNDLGISFRERFQATGADADLEAAIDAHKRCVAVLPPGSPRLSAALTNLGITLVERYSRTGRLGDLDDAIAAQRSALASLPSDSPDTGRLLGNLGLSLGQAYARSTEPARLEEAIGTFERALAVLPDDSPHLAPLLSNLGIVLNERFSHGGDPSDLDRSIEMQERALQAAGSHESPQRAPLLTNLGIALGGRYASTGDVADLDRAIALQEEAVELTPPDSPILPRLLNNLALGLSERSSSRSGR